MTVDARVYSVQVCADCLAQILPEGPAECAECGSLESRTARFRIDRSQLLKQADPRTSLVERTVYFGCVGQAGHYYWNRGSAARPYSRPGARDAATPWGYKVDGGLLPKRSGLNLDEGVVHVVHEHGWTALMFTDRSVDTRPGSWSVYCIPDTLDGPEALEIAREAFPTIFARYQFDVRLAT